MESLDLHPEELFDKAARGLASADELARIDAHLASCAACRFERQVRADFDAVTAGTDDLDDLVARAMSGATKEAAPAAEASSKVVPIRRRRWAPLMAAAIALMGFGSLAAIGQFTGVLPHLIEQLTSSDRTPAPPPPAPTPGPQKSKPEVAPPPAVEAPSVSDLLDVPEASATPEPQPVLPPEPVAIAQTPSPSRKRPAVPAPAPVVAPVAPAPVADSTPEIPAVKPTPPPAVPEPDALSVFSRAQRERVQGDTAAAIRDFRQVVARWPSTHEAALANAELGRLLLDRGEAASALEAFDTYLATRDSVLREDVLGARALALRALGRVEAERAAWEEVLREYPAGVYAPRARARLESLNPTREP